jgi:hypothetical protein
MKTIYTNYDKKVIVENGIVTYSDFEYCKIGQKPDTKALNACGWKKDRKPTVYYAGGGTSPQRFGK